MEHTQRRWISVQSDVSEHFFFKFTVNVFLAWLYAKIEKSHEKCVYGKHWQIQDKIFFKKYTYF